MDELLAYILSKKYAQSMGSEMLNFSVPNMCAHANLNGILEKLILDAIGNLLFNDNADINIPNINYNKEFTISESDWVQDPVDKEKYAWTKTHNLGTKNIECAAYNNLDEEVTVGVKAPNINTIILTNAKPFNGRIVINYSIEKTSNGGGSSTSSNGTVKMTAGDTDGKYLADLIDGLTIKNVNGQLVATTLNGLTVTIAELNSLSDIALNIQEKLNALTGTISLKDAHKATYSDLNITTGMEQGDAYIVDADETKGGEQTWYTYSGGKWACLGVIGAVTRDFLANPLNVIKESKGIYEESRIDPLIARKSDVPSIPNLSVLTTYTQTNEDLEAAVNEKHSHANKALLDTYTQTDGDLADAVSKKHNHENKAVIDNFSEDKDGKPLYKGNRITGGSNSIGDLSNFTTADLKDTTEYRYVTDTEKADIGNIPSIIAVQSNINNTLDTIANEISLSASSSNKLITVSEVDTKINNIKSVMIGGFIDDTSVRTDKTYSSSKISTILDEYALKSMVYTKTESNGLYASKLNEHTHANISALNKISEDSDGNMYFDGKKLSISMKPYTYQNHWDKQNYTTSTLLVDVNAIFNENKYNAILSTEFTVQNNITSVDEKTDALAEKQLHLVVIDNSITVLDVLIPPASVQKYLLGMSPNVQIMVQGQFSSNYYLTAY